MSDQLDTDTDTDVDAADTQAAESKRENWRRKLEADAEAGKAAVAEAAQARRELAFLKAGVDLDTPQGKLLAKAYDGEPTVEAVKAAAVEFGVLTADTPAVPAAELAAHDRIAAAASGGTTASDDQSAMAELLAADSEQEVLAVLHKWEIPVESSRPGRWERPEGMGTVPVQ